MHPSKQLPQDDHRHLLRTPLGIVICTLDRLVFYSVSTEWRVSPPTVPYYIPFGFDTLYQAVTVSFFTCYNSNKQYNNRNANFEFLKKCISQTHSTTFKVVPESHVTNVS